MEIDSLTIYGENRPISPAENQMESDREFQITEINRKSTPRIGTIL